VLRAEENASRVVRWVFSDGSVDRVGDTIDPNGWDLTAYRANPVVLFAHNAEAPPIGRTVRVFSDGSRLIGDIEFAPREVSEFADDVYKLVTAGYLKAGSVGFVPISWKFSDDPDRPFGIDFSRQELLEFSVVPVPALPSALIAAQARDASGYRERLRRVAQLRDGVRLGPRCETLEDRLARIEALRQRGADREVDPRILVADAAFRMQGLR
jgi:HK97 family phage prohead protease